MTRYSNPIARGGDFADPFVLRFDGRYYLYCTNPDVRCWSSPDLVHWTAQGPTIAPGTFDDLVPFAPEVVYSNGWFSMYTSPSGTGHYVLRSDSPTGPFVPVTANIGRDIDGHVLIDDDGRWYYYWAGDEGIWACEMRSPTEFGEPVLTGAFMHGWTEGPFVVKRDGWYHMTLTGNHFLSPGYRVNAAVSRDPLTGYVDDPLNPVLLSTAEPTLGLGHSSTVLGPDLVSHYLAYHNLNPDRTRDLDIDRLVWNRQSMQVLGPTTNAPAPRPPDHAGTWRSGHDGWRVTVGHLAVADGRAELAGPGAMVLWEAAPLRGAFTSEHNVAALDAAGPYAVAVASPQGSPVWLVRFDPAEGAVAVVEAGTTRVVAAALLPAGYAHEALHCVRLVLDGEHLVVFVDDRRQLTAGVRVSPGDLLGYVTSGGALRIGHTAVTHTVEREASRTAVRPLPGRFWAALAPAPALETVEGAVPYDRLVLEQGSEVAYAVDVAAGGPHTIYLTGDFGAGSALAVGVGEAGVVAVPAGHVVAVPMDLLSGEHVLRVRAVRGRAVVDLVTVEPAAPATAFELDGPATIVGDGKVLLGDEGRHDLTVEALVTVTTAAAEGHGDVLFRATQLADGFEGNAPRLGIDFLLGYSLQLHADRVVLARHDYDERVLVERRGAVDLTVPHRVVVRVRGSRIQAQVDDAEPIRWDDPLPHLAGGAGIRVFSGTIRADRFAVGQ